MNTKCGLVAGLALSLLGASAARGQATGAIAGRVSDSTGGMIAGARVEMVGPGRGAAITDAAGAYRIAGLTPGSYTVLVTKNKFAPVNRGPVTVTAVSVSRLDVTLELAPREETATVEGEKPLGLDPSESAGAIVLRGEDLDALPDDPDDMAEALRALAGPAAGPSGGQMFIDGFSSGRLPPKASIREIRLNMNPFSAEYDRLGFGRIEILTKPGTDRLRGGTSFEFMDATLNSRNPFASNRPPYQRREWAGNLGGPLSRKGSFFVDFERRDIDDNELINATILDSSLEPVSLSLAVIAPHQRTTVSPRLDFQFGGKHTLVARYAYLESRHEKAGIGGFSLPERAYASSHRQDTFQLTETSILSDRVANETRIQYDRERSRRQGDNSPPTIHVLEAFTGGGSPVGRSHDDEDRIEVHNVTTWTRGKHSVRAGLRLRGVRNENFSDNNFGGTVTFAGGLGPLLDADNRVVLGPDGQPVRIALTSLERYRRTLLFQRMGLSAAEIRARGGGATQLRIAGGNPEAGVTQWDVAPFVQDDWKATPSFTLSLGLRYENQTNIRSDWNLAPRLAFAFSPHRGDERPRTVVRGGFGVFYERFGHDLTLQARRFDGVNQQQFLVSSPAVLDRLEFTRDTVLGFPSTVELSGFALPQNMRVVAPGLQAPRTLQASLSFEQLLPGSVTFSVVAVSTRIRQMLRSRNITAPPAGAARPPNASDTVYQYESTGRFDQEQLIFGLNSRTSRAVTLFARYFLGRARSDTDGAGSFPADSNDLAAEYGPAGVDVRHRFTLGGTVRLPWNVRLNPLVIYSSGAPFNITTGRDNNGDTLFTDRPAAATDPNKPGVVQTPWGLLDPDPGPGQAIIPRNLGRGPWFLVANLRVGKTIGFGKRPEARTLDDGARRPPPATLPPGPAGRDGEGRGGDDRAMRGLRERSEGRVTLTFSLNAQNVLNHVNAGPPVGNLGSPLFGKPVATAGPFGFGAGGTAAGNRRIELQARLAF
ncbi:MAG TPA: carboxypeptidase regulatory-like domain-containing protein [Vicinamibacteria bacterium]